MTSAARFLIGTTALSACLCVIAPFSVYAEDARIKASLSETALWDSNPLMTLNAHETVYGLVTTPTFSLEKGFPVGSVEIEARVDNSVYDKTKFNTTDLQGTAAWTRRTERADVSLGVRGQYDTTRTGELTTFGTETTDVRRTLYAATPSFSYELSPLSRIAFDGTYETVRYDDVLATAHTNYRTISSNAAYFIKLSPVHTGFAGVYGRRYETTEGLDRRVDGLGPFVGLETALSKTWNGRARLGQQFSRETIAGTVVSDWTRASVLSTELRYQGEQGSLRLAAERAQQSYSNGQDELLTTLSVEGEREIAPRLSWSLGATHQFSDDAQTVPGQLDARSSGRARLTYSFTETLAVAASCTYRHETFAERSGRAERTIARLALTYTPVLDDFR